MSKFSLEISYKQVEDLIDKLPVRDKIRLVRKIEQQTWAKKLDQAVLKIRNRLSKNPLSPQEVDRICQQTRKRNHRERAKRHS